MTKVAIIGSHGLFANYGGWDQLVNNLALKKTKEFEYLIFNSRDTKIIAEPPEGVRVKQLIFKAAGFEGLFFDFFSILLCFRKVDTILLLGVQGIPLLRIIKVFRKVSIVSNVGGIEWERPKFNRPAKLYLKYCFNLSLLHSKYVILDNPHYSVFLPEKYKAEVKIIPYGGEIDTTLDISRTIEEKYPFIVKDYFLSISRSLKDNYLDELCLSFVGSDFQLVLISNLSRSAYGTEILEKYSSIPNITLINGLYDKQELDLIRRNCKAYIHTHTLCGTAPSLVEMIIAGRPIFSIDIPQNRYTLHNQGYFFKTFPEIQKVLKEDNPANYVPDDEIRSLYSWEKIVADYESLLVK